MIWRPWVISSLLLIAVVVNGVLLSRERLPTPEVREELEKRFDEPLRSLQYLPSNRRNNFGVMGMSDELADATANHIARFDRQKERFRKMLGESVEMIDVICPSEKLPQPYSMLGYLVIEENKIRTIAEPQNIVAFELQPWFEQSPVSSLYNTFERTESRRAEATIMAVSAALLGREASALNRESPWSESLIGSWGFQRLKSKDPRVERLVIEYFALMHFLTEIANEPQRGICS